MAVALGAVPVFWLSRRHLASERVAFIVALVYLSYPWLAWTALDAMHPLTLAIPLFLFAIWFLDTGRVIPFAVCAALVASTGELMGLPIAILGLWYWLSRGHRVAGIVVACAGLAWTAVSIKLIVPAFSGSSSDFYRYFEAVGGSPEGVLKTAIEDPGVLFHTAFSTRDGLYSLALAAPLCAVFVAAPGIAVAAVPQLGANLLSSITVHTDPRAHGIAGVMPFLMAASVFGLARLPRARQASIALAMLAACICFSVLWGAWQIPGGRYAVIHDWYYGAPSEKHLAAVSRAVHLVPTDAPVAATNRAGSQLSARRYFFSVPRIGSAQWVVVDMQDPWVPLPSLSGSTWGRFSPSLLSKMTARLRSSSQWKEVFERNNVFVFRRTSP
jgi:uncharacterized membrane protein